VRATAGYWSSLAAMIALAHRALGAAVSAFLRALSRSRHNEGGQRRIDVIAFLHIAQALGFDASRAIKAIEKR
jgi:hypothetical protein